MTTDIPVKEWADKANIILESANKGIEFKANKDALAALFKEKAPSVENIRLRLYVLDSLYSTQMKPIFGFHELSEALFKLHESKEGLIECCNLYLNRLNSVNADPEDIIHNIFSGHYGINKEEPKLDAQGSPIDGRHAVSLISKYLYFATNYRFPIYDSLAKKAYKSLKKKYFSNTQALIANLDYCNFTGYFDALNKLNHESGIHDFNKLDNLLWIIGKIDHGSFSYLIPLTQFQQLKMKYYENRQKDPESYKNKDGHFVPFDQGVRSFLGQRPDFFEKEFSDTTPLNELIKFVFDLIPLNSKNKK
ncbi:hypothetical protein SAMN05192529_11442 [Arachidicoccus rhizosphaerae]|uniref:Uncharacterized protein n=1 Tax=Arachidicoccus rhizosphaerae TaxID=551991 RepID=A0A1H4AE11_9BACT|nr:hypothetical protein [Arachidicoccus rhizosphaerae]SEA33744.1 hypothetical protein SAMN05192529_11442 [Arachidicoccus rhizosphaerae]